MIHLLNVFLLQLIATCSGEFCSNECGPGDVKWCGERKVVGQDLLACAEWSKKGERCLNKCEKGEEEFTWCYVGNQNGLWDYCAPVGLTRYGKKCVGECNKKEGGVETYWWCSTNATDDDWDYCSPEAKVVKVEYTITDQECGGECAQQGGEDYWWCRKPMRWAGKYSDANWDYCSPEPTRTRYNKQCEDECSTKGEDYHWCKTGGEESWDYCSIKPALNTTVQRTSAGHLCAGPCDFFSSSNKWCVIKEGWESGSYWWDYCSGSLMSSSSSATVMMILLLHFATCSLL